MKSVFRQFLIITIVMPVVLCFFPVNRTVAESGYTLPSFTDSEYAGLRDARVKVENGVLKVDGKPVFLYGGELQYFRVRDPEFDPSETVRIWEETLDAMKDAGMNFVSTYVPWDYHEAAEGVFDFSGARDLELFLSLCAERNMYVAIRPGPYINAEWPEGYGTFGAVPDWVRDDYPETLCMTKDGNYYPQPTYLHPEFLDLVQSWFTGLAPILKKYIFEVPCIVSLQLDNETNFFFRDCYDIDYSPTMLSWYREKLEEEYGSIGELNRVYRTGYTSFSEVDPPDRAPLFPSWRRDENPAHADWGDITDRYILEYLMRLKEFWVNLGITDDDVLFTTNDPYSAAVVYPIHLHVGPRKNIPGLAGVDFYPKMLPYSGELMDFPYIADFTTKLFGCYNSLAGYENFVFGAEVQDGWFMRGTRVKPEETAQLLVGSVGHGMKAVSLYVIRDGYNLDGSVYDFKAALDIHGNRTDRFDAVAGFGNNLITPFGVELMKSVEIEDEVAILVYWPHLFPQGGILDNIQNLSTFEQGALFGMLENSGYNPAVIDLHEASAEDLLNYRAVFFMNPDYIDGPDAAKLLDYVDQGGILVNMLWKGKNDLDWFPSGENREFTRALFPARMLYYIPWAPAGLWPFGDDVRYEFDGEEGFLRGSYYMNTWSLLFHPDCKPFLFDPATGLTVGYTKEWGEGKAYFIGTHLESLFNRGIYYYMDGELPAETEILLDWMLEKNGVIKAVDARGIREEAWARKVPGAEIAYIFIKNNHDAATLSVDLDAPERFGLVPAHEYQLEEVLSGKNLGRSTGEEISSEGIAVELGKYGTAVVRIAPVS